MTNFTHFENQYILMLASRAKRDLLEEIEQDKEKMKLYNTAESFLDPNIEKYIETLNSVIKKVKEDMTEQYLK
jgi:hypothetical protein